MRTLTRDEKIALLDKMKLLLKQKKEELEILKAIKERNSGTNFSETNDKQLVAEEEKCAKVSPKKSLKRKLQFDESISSTSAPKNSEATVASVAIDGAESISKSCGDTTQPISSEASRCEEIQDPSILLTENDDLQSTVIGCHSEGFEKLKSQTELDSDLHLNPEEVDPVFASLKRRKIQEEKQENSYPKKLSEAEHLPELSCQTPSQVLDFHWFTDFVPLTNQEQGDSGYLLCTCEKGLLVYKENAGNWAKIVDWTVEEETIKSASILRVHKDKLALHVSVVALSTSSIEMTSHSKQSHVHETSLVKFSDGQLSCRNSVRRFTGVHDSVLQCTILPDDICIASTSSPSSSLSPNKTGSNDERGRPDLVTSVEHLKVCINSLSMTSSKELQGVSDRILHLLQVSKSSVLCGLSRDGAYLWHYEAGFLLKKFTFEVECLDFTPCCDLIHQDRGLLVLAGRTPEDGQGRLVFLNPMSGISVSMALRELISACNINELRLLRCGGPLHKAVFVSESRSQVLDVFSTTGNKVTISKALVPRGCYSRSGARSDMVVKFDSKLRQMSFGRDDGFCVCRIELD